MKKLFSVFLASLLLLQLSLFALADSSKSAAAAQQFAGHRQCDAVCKE